MRYIKLSFEYMKNKHYWKIMLMMLLPALLLSFLSTYSTTASFFLNFFNRTPDELTSFATIFGLFTELSEHTISKLVMFLLIATALSAIFAVAIGVIHKHMRTGRFMLRNIFKRFNENFLQAFSTVITIFLLVFLFGVLMTLNVYFWYNVTKHIVVTFVMSLIFMLVLFAIMIISTSMLSLSCPYMVGMGKGFLSAASSSIKTTRKKFWDIICAIIIPLIPLFAIEYGISCANIRALSIITDMIVNTILFSYYPVMIFVIFYDLEKWDRNDLLAINKLY